jgi:Domain of unknown function (DUF4450)/Bacterial alpha-L-rhamnosidase 6 hairpin glycosidase domain
MKRYYLLSLSLFISQIGFSQSTQKLWHNIKREVRYHPEGNDIVIENGRKRFNRALYGGNTAFRTEAGDLPEFAMYMPGMGGNMKFGIMNGESKWLIDAQYIKASYQAGAMLYKIKDPLLNNGTIYLRIVALYDREGFMVQLKTDHIPSNLNLVVAFGGATGKKFSRDGDIGADPESSFYLKPEYCKDNIYKINRNSFSLLYGFTKTLSDDDRYEVQHLPAGAPKTNDKVADAKKIRGVFPPDVEIKVSDAAALTTPKTVLYADSSVTPVIVAKKLLNADEELYFFAGKQDEGVDLKYEDLQKIFFAADQQRKKLAERIKINTPDSCINTLGPVLGIAADAVWEDPSFMHGAVAWRMRLNGWRGAYMADVLGWHDRAKKHFNGYALSQITAPLTGPVIADTSLHLGRQLEKLGTSLFSNGYISRNPGGDLRAHHYDMNLVFIDQLLNHFNWTGDTGYVKKMWPLIQRHLAWEKRNFDADGDGLYDAYAAIWASDALQYSGGGVTHSSAYNFRCNKMAAQLARLIGEDALPYEKESAKIIAAINKQLWMPQKGWYAEYKDLLGNKLIHPAAGLWTIYHAIDEGIANPFQSYQSLRYIDNEIPHIPILANGLTDTSLYTLSTTNWQPYTWSLNNVALAELLHTSLAYWQGGRSEEAFTLWKSSLVESMFLGASPGNMQQLSFYDAIRGELYRDFADPIAMTARTVVEGLFGIEPNLLKDSLTVKPGFPEAWNFATLETPDIGFGFERNGLTDTYSIHCKFVKGPHIRMQIPAYKDGIETVSVNKTNLAWSMMPDAVGKPMIRFDLPLADKYEISITWKGASFGKLIFKKNILPGENIQVNSKNIQLLKLYDPQTIFLSSAFGNTNFTGKLADVTGNKTFFIRVKQGSFSWWQPVDIKIKESIVIKAKPILSGETIFQKIDLTPYFNDAVSSIFKNQYLSPRPAVPTLQLPTQGIGNWAYPLTTAVINDSGLRVRAGNKNEIITSEKIPFATPGGFEKKNIVFTSQWDNFPDSVIIPISGRSSYAYFMMAGSTNPMQSRLLNGAIIINYKDGSSDKLELKNPENWWPIEQDYYTDGFAFTTNAEKPLRVYLKTGEDTRGFKKFTGIKGFSNWGIDGGAATVLSLPLNNNKELKNLVLKTIANDVVIGLMSVTLIK